MDHAVAVREDGVAHERRQVGRVPGHRADVVELAHGRIGAAGEAGAHHVVRRESHLLHCDRVADQVVVAILAKDGDVVCIEMEAVFRRHIGQEVHAHHGAHGRTLSQQLVELTFGRCVA